MQLPGEEGRLQMRPFSPLPYTAPHTSLILTDRVAQSCSWTQVAKPHGGAVGCRGSTQALKALTTTHKTESTNRSWLLSAKWTVMTNEIWKKVRGIKRRANNTLHWVFILSRSVTWPLLGVLNYLTVGFNTITCTVQTKKHYKIISAQSHHFCMSYSRHFNVCKWPPVT